LIILELTPWSICADPSQGLSLNRSGWSGPAGGLARAVVMAQVVLLSVCGREKLER